MTKKVIGIDANEANSSVRVGVGQYAYHVIKELYNLDTKNQYFIYLKSAPLPDMPPERPNWQYVVFGPGKLWTRFALPLHLFFDGRKLDFFYSPIHYSPLFSPFPTIPTIHDLGYLDTPLQFTRKDFHQLKHWTERSLQKATKIIAVSKFTRSEIHRIYGIPLNKIAVAPNGVDPAPTISAGESAKILKKYGLKSPFFLYLGTLKPSKNIPFLISAFSKYLKSGSPRVKTLVIAGKKGWLYDEIFAAVKKEGIEKNVVFTDFLDGSAKWVLYSKAQATVVPSLYEGFGIPAIESQACGTPVIASAIPAFEEVVKNSALLIDPNKEKELVKAMIRITDPTLRKKLISDGNNNFPLFSWAASARSLLKVFESI